ncbi:MAG: murein biosynthesis integral rane protein MurJ, partial [Actinomycetota bacterium]
FYALEDTRTPFFLQVLQATVFIGLALTVSTLPTGQIAFGLAASASFAGTLQTVVAIAVVRRKLGGISLMPLVARFGVFWLAALPASAGGVGVLVWLAGPDGSGFWSNSAVWAGVVMALITVMMVSVYVAVLLVMRNQEAFDIVRPVMRRLPFRKSRNTST